MSDFSLRDAAASDSARQTLRPVAVGGRAGSTSMRCHAVIDTEYVPGRDESRIARLRKQAPLVPRSTQPTGFEPYVRRGVGPARVALATGAAGPLGGDEYLLEINVGVGSTLVLREVSATLVLPGPHALPSLMRCRVNVAAGASLVWIPEPIIAARGCDHTQHVEIELAADARLFYREELVLGRHGEAPGNLSSFISVRREGSPLSIQQFDLGPRHPGWRSAAVAGGKSAIGSVVIVEPNGAPGPRRRLVDELTLLAHVEERTTQITALADDSLTLRGRLDAALAEIGQPWGDPKSQVWSAVPR